MVSSKAAITQLLSSLLIVNTTAQSNSTSKRGIAYLGTSTPQDYNLFTTKSSPLKWYYNWSPNPVTETVVDAVASLDVQKGVRHNHATISRRQEIWGISIFSVAFLMWGLAYGLLDIMNYHIKVVMSISRREAAYLAMAYYFAYFVGAPIIGGPIVKRAGYRLALVAGFVLLATGNELMSVGAEKLQFPMMCFAHFVVGSGVSTLERGANAYATNCGHRSRAVLRILFAQTWAGIGTIIAPALANAVIFDPTKSTSPPNRDPLHAGRCLMPSLSTDGVDLSSVVG